jgi:hypothetical protein
MEHNTSKFIWELHRLFFSKPETIIEILFIFLNAGNIFLNYGNNYRVILITSMLALIYFNYSPRKAIDKSELLFIFVAFSLATGIVESYLISYSGGIAIQYGKTGERLNIPSWLFCAYLSMVMIMLGLQRYYQQVLIPIIQHNK